MLKTESNPVISVGIMSDNKINFELYGDFKSAGMKQVFSGRFTAEIVNDLIVCKSSKDKIEISGEITFTPQDPTIDSFLLRNVIIGAAFHWERKEKQRFTGSLKLLKDKDKIIAINVLPVENYLYSVISSEMSAKSSLQLLKAHAVVSRSWLFAQLEKKKVPNIKNKFNSNFVSENEIIRWSDRKQHTLYDVCADDHCQRYQGISKILSSTAKQAIQETVGLVIISNDDICDARYSKACGGITETFENVWEPEQHNYLKSIIDYKYEPDNYNLDFSKERNAEKWIKGNPHAFCNTKDSRILTQILIDYDRETKDFFRWTVEYSQEEIASLIRSKTGVDFGEIIEFKPIERGKSARLIKLQITGTKKTMIIGKELEIRRILSESHLYSSAIFFEKGNEVNKIPQSFKIHGAGWGHGVGLCQIGAAVMASQGYQFDEILLHYFKNAEIKKIY